MRKALYLIPRILSIVFILFISLFSFDVFDSFSGWAAVLPLVMHLLIPIVLLIGLLLAWKWDMVGVIIFLGFAIYYIWMVGLGRHWSWYATISGPAVVIGILFLVNYLAKKRAV